MARRWMAALALLLLWLVPARLAEAAGPGQGGRQIQLEDEPAGPYVVRVVTSPTPPRVENLYLEVRVTEAATGRVVTDARVFAAAAPAEGDGPLVEAEATHDIAPIPTEYAAHLVVPTAGTWRVRVRVEGAEGTGEVTFLVRVLEPSSLGAVVSVGLPVAGLVALGVIFLLLQRRHGRSPGAAAPGEDSRA